MSSFSDKYEIFSAKLKEKYPLSLPGSLKNTHHFVLQVDHPEFSYQVGESIGILPHHDDQLVKKTLLAIEANGDEIIFDKERKKEYLLEFFLKEKVNITEIHRKLMKEVAFKQSDFKKKKELEILLLEENREKYKEFLTFYEVWDFLEEHREVKFSPQEFVDLLLPLRPRFYSIASSKRLVGNEIHLTVALLQFQTNGKERKGVCSDFLYQIDKNKDIFFFLQPSPHFFLPEDPNSSLIMIGPGTGIAPFRGFLQERKARGDEGKNWLFFGERHAKTDFFYQEEWLPLTKENKLILDVAFSRDQEEKVYVQHKMWEKGDKLYSWLEDGAYLFVCGDAKKMAKDVEEMLYRIVKHFGNKSEQETKEYIKLLRKQKRYQRDVY